VSTPNAAPSLHDVHEPIAERLAWPLVTPDAGIDPMQFADREFSDEEIKTLVAELQANMGLSPDTIVRVELIYKENDTNGRRGALLFDDSSEEPIFYVPGAFIGCAGTRKSLGVILLQAIGLPSDLIRSIQRGTDCPPYLVIASRQTTEFIGDIEVPVKGTEPDSWEWWRAD
jgi:hypothetical protein